MSADLIVLGTHGLSGLQHLLLGSVTEKVLRRARCPVLTVPAAGTVKSRLPFERILCAIDFSDWSLRALEYAITATLGSGASLTLAHVLEWPWLEPPPPNFAELPVEEATALAAFRVRRERSAHARLELFEPEGLKERCHIRVVHGRAHDQLLHIAAEENADLIVVGVHGRVGLDLALFGSTANQLVRHATCPVLTVRH
jgi:nucleotide-binding universal stress UspA family protein